MRKQLKALWHRMAVWARQRRVALLVSLCNAVVLTVLTYMLNNQALFTGEDLNHFAWMEIAKSRLGLAEQADWQDVLLVNIAYDKQLAERYDDYGMTVGNVDITDRTKLLELLRMLHTSNEYAYIFLDVRFEKGFEAPEADSLLFAKIGQMRDIVIANHTDIEIADSLLLGKAAISDYESTIISTNFVRYRYSYDGRPSIPLYAYRELTGRMINGHGLWYSCDGRLCYNSLFVNFPVEDFGEFNSEDKKAYYNLGSDLLENYTTEDMAVLTRGKYVVIGDMIEDMHDTYSGPKPGAVITFNAFWALMEGRHYVSYGLVLLMAVLYFAISLSQFSRRGLWERISVVRKSQSRLLHFGLSFLEYTLLLSAVVICLYVFWGVSTSILLPSMYFAIQKNIINYKRTKI